MKIKHLFFLLKACLLIAFQVLIFNNMYLLRYATPYPYVVLLLFLPISSSNGKTTFIAGIVGLIIDILQGMPGVHTAAFTLLGFLRNYLLVPFIDPETDRSKSVSYQAIRGKVFVYLLLLVLIHHFTFFILEAAASFNFRYFLLRLLESHTLSLFYFCY